MFVLWVKLKYSENKGLSHETVEIWRFMQPGKGLCRRQQQLNTCTWESVLLRPVFIYRWQNKPVRSVGEGLQWATEKWH